MSEFVAGAGSFFAGFGMWRSRPKLMALALLPALAVLIVMGTLLSWLGVWLVGLVPGWTGFADSWPGWLAGLLRFALASGITLALALLLIVTYTSITLAVGDPLYARISQETDALLGGPVPNHSGGWNWVGDTLRLALRGLVGGLLVGLIGLVPGVGGLVAAIAGFVLSSWLLVTGLTTGSLERRGLDYRARTRLLRSRAWRALGFGMAAQLFFLIPGGAVLIMPSASSGATRLARSLTASTAS
ncbi:MAG: EI24 domain-containing protein [Propionicimonas sp.]